MEETSFQSDHAEAIHLLGVRIHNLSVPHLLNAVSRAILVRRKSLIAYVNVHAMNLAYELAWFRDFLNDADFAFCDGFGVKWGARLLGLRIVYRNTPPDWLPLLCRMCVQRDYSLFFLGARPGVAEKAVSDLKKQFPDLNVVGTYHGYFDKSMDSRENEAIIQRINTVAPHILVVGFGMPLQEKWLLENWERVNAVVAIPVGAAFDYISGETYRFPRWITDYGFEWLGRLLVEPHRLWKRYLIGNPLFLWRVLKQRLGLLSYDEQ